MKNQSPLSFLTLVVVLLAGCNNTSFSGDGEHRFQLAFYSTRTGNGNIFLLDTTRQVVQPLTSSDSSCFAPRWHPGFKAIIYAEQTPAGAMLKRQSSDLSRPPITIAQNPAYYEVPNWSPDGERTVFTTRVYGKPQIALGDQNGKIIVMLTRDTFSNKQPVFSPSGKAILFVSNRRGNQDIYQLDLSKQALKNLTNHPAKEGHPQWSPQGDKILFYRYENGNADLYTLDLTTKTVRNITNTPYDEWIGRFSPDGQYVAMSGEADGDMEIFVARSDGSNRRRLTNQKGFDGDPIWIPGN
jgi:Tol biopolymer transport system component